MTKRNERFLWVVEGWYPDLYEFWHSTTGIALTRDEGRLELKEWKQRNPDDKFRLVQYRAKA